MSERRLSDRVVDGFAVGFAAWTLVCQTAIALALPFRVLVAAGLVVLAALATWSAARRRSRADARSDSEPASSSASSGDENPRTSGAIDRHLALWLCAALAVAGA